MNPALLLALIAVESGGDPRAIGDNGKSVGVLQIGASVVLDVNRIYGTRYKWPTDCFNARTSAVICVQYLKLYTEPYDSDEVIAREWNGGPKGHRKPSTLKYWNKVKQQLEEM